MMETGNTVTQLSDIKLIMSFAFLVDITGRKGKLLADLFSNVKALKAKLYLLKKHMIEENPHQFPCCQLYLFDWQIQKETFIGWYHSIFSI